MSLKWLRIGRYLVGRCLCSGVCALGHSGAPLPRYGGGRGSGGALSIVCSGLGWGLSYFRHFEMSDELVCNRISPVSLNQSEIPREFIPDEKLSYLQITSAVNT